MAMGKDGIAAQMIEAASRLLDALDPEQISIARRSFPDEEERRLWFYTPTDHGGLPLSAMNAGQHRLVHQLVASGLSLIFGLMDVLSLAHGEIFMLGAYAGWTVYTRFDTFLDVAVPLLVMLAPFMLLPMWRRLAEAVRRLSSVANLAVWLAAVAAVVVGIIAVAGGGGEAAEAAEAMGLTAERLKGLELVDTIVEEPLGGAHRDVDAMAQNMKAALLDSLTYLQSLPKDKLLESRYERLMSFGNYTE